MNRKSGLKTVNISSLSTFSSWLICDVIGVDLLVWIAQGQSASIRMQTTDSGKRFFIAAMCVAACILYFASSAEAVSYSQNDIGTTGISGTYNQSGQTYTVGGGGTGVLAGSDNFSFVSTTATGNVEFVGKVTSQTNTGAYAVAGLMVRDSATSATAQTAYISVSPLNGVNFTSRLTDGTTATRTLGSSVASPIWLRMVVTGSSVAG